MLASLAGLALAVTAPQGPALTFLDFSNELKKPSLALVVGTLGRVTEGKKERLKAGEGTLDEGGISTSISGTVFAKVTATAKVTVTKALHGTKDVALTVAFDMQTAKIGDGSQRRHFLLTPRVPLEDAMLALFFVDQGKSGNTVTRVVRYDPKKGGTPDTFRSLCEDLYTLNARILELREACETANKLRATDTKAAVESLRKVLTKKLSLHEAESETWRRMQVTPHEQKAKELFDSLGGKLDPSGEPIPVTDSAPTKK